MTNEELKQEFDKLLEEIKEYGKKLDKHIEKYKEEYPQFRVDENGYILKWEEESLYEVMLSSYVKDISKKFCRSIWNDLKPIPYNKERGLYHKQPVWFRLYDCENTVDIYEIGYYNAQNDSIIYSINGATCHYDEIKPITPEQLKTIPFVFEMYKQLKD